MTQECKSKIKRCIETGCNASAIGKTDKCKAHGGCFKEIFPNDERSKVIYRLTKEIMVRNVINKNFEGFTHDKPLYTGNCD